MMPVINGYSAAWQLRDQRTRCEWAAEFVSVPNMARGSRFDVTATPWAQEPIDFSADTRVREQIILWPTGAGKSNFVDVFTAHSAAEVDGDILLAVQGNLEAKKYVEKRLVPCLQRIPKVAARLEKMGRHAIKKGSISLPDKTIYWGGANETNAQATSARAVLVDEAWMADHGLLQQFRARLHSRWNRIFVALGQGGREKIEIEHQSVDTEWHAAWKRTDQREWCFECPQCREVQRYRLRGLRYEKQDGEEVDERAIYQSARYECVGVSREKQTCDAVFPDNVNVRRSLANTGRYVPQKLDALEHHHGWHLNALGLWYETWGELAVMHAAAHRARKRGDEEPFNILRQKRMAENVREAEQQQNTTLKLGGYKLADYLNGETWEGEALRAMTVDVQRDHFWAVVRAWKADGSSRRIYVGRINTIEAVRELQQRLKVEDRYVGMDAQFDTDMVYNLCADFGWFAMHGDKADSYSFPLQGGLRKFFSPVRIVQGTRGKKARAFHWSNRQIKRILEKFRGGYREAWEVEGDITPEHQAHLFSEIEKDVINKQTKAIERRFVVIGSRQNHTWDCEAMGVVLALVFGMLRDRPELKSGKPCQLTPVAGKDAEPDTANENNPSPREDGGAG